MKNGFEPSLEMLLLKEIISVIPVFAVVTWFMKSVLGQQILQDYLVGLTNIWLQPVSMSAIRELMSLLLLVFLSISLLFWFGNSLAEDAERAIREFKNVQR